MDQDLRTNGRDPSVCYNLSGKFAHELHYIGVAPLPRGGMRKKRIATPVQWNYKHTIDVDPPAYILYDQ
jgi:hypothetical protein